VVVAHVGLVAESQFDAHLVCKVTMPGTADTPRDRRFRGCRVGCKGVGMNVLSLVATIVVLVGVAVFILLFERQRARGIERDLRDQGRGRREDGGDPDGQGRG